MTAAIYPAGRERLERLASLHAPAWLEVNLDALRQNAASLRARAGVPLVPMVKADGYGLGAVAIARALGASFADRPVAADGPWGLGVARVAEAAALRDSGCTARLLCSTPLLPQEFSAAMALELTPTLHGAESIAEWIGGKGGAWHLAIDTGMSRAGVRWDRVSTLRSAVGALMAQHPPEGVLTHFHSADEGNRSRVLQEARFAESIEVLREFLTPQTLIHTDNSAAISARGASQATLVRPGIALYGAYAVANAAAQATGDGAERGEPAVLLQPVVSLRARIVDLRDVLPGETVGYGATWTAARPSRIATVPVGYADGYRRQLSNRGAVLVHGVRCPVVGRISMDMAMLDVTGVACAEADVVTMLGADGPDLLSVDEVARAGDLSPYELLTGLGQRLPRVYLGAS